ncbi:MAG: SDR family NAD(P)-dependent oxidoreductase [Burkholderiales bacterium]|jgi:short-subunit dehydrogenase
MLDKKNRKVALITGASGGIGREIAEILLVKGYDLLLVARSLGKLEEVREKFKSIARDQTVTVLQADLSHSESPKMIFDFASDRNISVDILVNNAGVGISGAIDEYSEEALLKMILLNIFSLTALCKYFTPQMKERRSGNILNIASLGGYQPVPYLAAYAASKSYVLNFSDAIAMELEDYGISVSCYSPGLTDTQFFDRADINENNNFYAKKMRVSPKVVAQDAVEKMLRGKLSSIYGFKNNALAFLTQITPSRNIIARITKKLVTK